MTALSGFNPSGLLFALEASVAFSGEASGAPMRASHVDRPGRSGEVV